MKRFLTFVVFLLLFLIPKPTYAFSDYVIESFQSDVLVMQDTSVSITETIKANFLYSKHGIFRTIPVIYSANGRSINSHLTVVGVYDENDNPYPYTSSRLNQSIQLKIGDPDHTLTGKHTYRIKYRLRGVIQVFNGSPEFYWNVTGHEWDTDIMTSSVTVSSLYAKPSEVNCYTGSFRSVENDCNKSFGEEKALLSTTSILPGEDFTIAVKYDPQNSLIFPSFNQKLGNIILDNWGYAPAIFPFFAMLLIWYKKGRDEKFVGDNYYYKPDNPKTQTTSLFKREHIPLVYHPLDGLTPAQVGTVVDERVDIHDVIAEIVEMARLKYLQLTKLPKGRIFSKQDYAIVKLKNDESKLTDYQREILKELFRSPIKLGSVYEVTKLIDNPVEEEKQLESMIGKDYVTLSSLKNHFYVALPQIKKKLYKSLEEKDVFDGDPESVRIKYIALYIFMNFIFGFTTFFYGVNYFNFAPIGLAILLAAVGMIIAIQMPKKTAWGHSLFKQSQGLRDYLRLGKWRYDYAEDNLFFEEIVPLAISLGVVNKLATDMAGLGMQPPSYMSGFTMNSFVADMTNFQTRAVSTLTSMPGNSGHSSWSGGSGFSGGGFSGGGFGGGGGGSW